MKPQILGSTLEVSDPKAIRFLQSANGLVYLKPFIGTENTVSSAAQALGVRPDLYLHQVRRMLRLGLLQQTRTQQRAGRAIKWYQSCAEHFVVSGGSLEWLSQFDPDFLAALEPSSAGDIQIMYAKDTEPLPEPVKSQLERQLALDSAAMVALSGEIRLDFADAKAMQRELLAIWQKYSKRTGGQKYQIRIGLAASR